MNCPFLRKSFLPSRCKDPSGLFMNCSDESVKTKTFLGRSSRNRGPTAGSWVACYRKHGGQSTGRKGFVQGAQRLQQQTALVSILEFLRTKSCCSMQSLKFLLKILIFFCSPLKKKKNQTQSLMPSRQVLLLLSYILPACIMFLS